MMGVVGWGPSVKALLWSTRARQRQLNQRFTRLSSRLSSLVEHSPPPHQRLTLLGLWDVLLASCVPSTKTRPLNSGWFSRMCVARSSAAVFLRIWGSFSRSVHDAVSIDR